MRQQASATTILLQQALALHQQEKLKPAEELYKKVLAKAPGHFEANYLYGMLKLHQEDWEAAEAQLGKAIGLNPDHVDTYFDRGDALEHLGRLDEALQCHERALFLKPDFIQAERMRARILQSLQRHDEALASYAKVTAAGAGDAQVWFEYGNALHGRGRLHESVAAYRDALAQQPDFLEALFNLGNTLKDLGKLQEAEDCYRKALAIEPKFVQAISNLSYVLHQQGKSEEALEAYDESSEVSEDSVELWFNRGSTLEHLQRFDEALQKYQRALQVDPDYAPAHWNESLLHLLRGDFEAGWKKYEWRWRTDQMRDQQRVFDKPLWLGQEPLEGKTILIHAEQGFGDTLQFIRFASVLARRGARVVALVQRELRDLLATAPGISQTAVSTGEAPPFDFHCPLMSLPLACGMTAEADIPQAPYLVADAARWSNWYQRLAPKRGLRIGLVWAGSPSSGNPGALYIDPQRSIPFATLSPLITLQRTYPDIEFHSLQVGEASAQLSQSPIARLVHNHSDELKDFSDTAALLANLDLLISVDTSVCHLAGALGKPVWLLNRFNTCWRWQLEREDTPWYSNFTLFRQARDEDWSLVVSRVRAALTQILEA